MIPANKSSVLLVWVKRTSSKADILQALMFMVCSNIAQPAYLNAKHYNITRVFFSGGFVRNNPLLWNKLSSSIDYWSKGKMRVHSIFFQFHRLTATASLRPLLGACSSHTSFCTMAISMPSVHCCLGRQSLRHLLQHKRNRQKNSSTVRLYFCYSALTHCDGMYLLMRLPCALQQQDLFFAHEFV